MQTLTDVGASQGRRRRLLPSRPSIRQLSLVAALVVSVLAATDAAGLLWASGRVQRASAIFARHLASRDITLELERSLMRYQRSSDLALLTREPSARIARSDIEEELLSVTERALRYADSERERRLLLELSRHVGTYVHEREELHLANPSPHQIVNVGTESQDRILHDLAQLRDLNDVEVAAAHTEALRAQQWASWIGYFSLGLLCVGVLIAVFALRRYFVRPIIQLSRSIAAFRGGDLSLRAREEGTEETVELARAFNEMMGLLARQRALQLASLGGVAHDLRSPLAALSMGLEVMRLENDEHARAELIERLEKQAERLQRMVSDFLDVARIEAGQLELRKARVDLTSVVAGVVEMYVDMAPGHRIELDRLSSPLTVEADALRIEQVVANLLSNAIKYSPGAPEVRVSLAAAGDDAVLEVRDHGIGMTTEELHEIFTPFRRHAKDVAPGVGLGLSVVRRIVEAHGGRIEVESAKGVGTTFRVRLPRADARREEPRPLASAPS